MFFKSRKADCLGIEDWYLWKVFADKTKRERKIAQNCDFALINKETEKACLVMFVRSTPTMVDSVEVWVPKSVMGMAPKSEAAQRVEKEKAEKFEAGCSRYEKVLSFAKEHKIKGVRSGLKLETLLNKISEAGLVFEEKEGKK